MYVIIQKHRFKNRPLQFSNLGVKFWQSKKLRFVVHDCSSNLFVAIPAYSHSQRCCRSPVNPFLDGSFVLRPLILSVLNAPNFKNRIAILKRNVFEIVSPKQFKNQPIGGLVGFYFFFVALDFPNKWFWEKGIHWPTKAKILNCNLFQSIRCELVCTD